MTKKKQQRAMNAKLKLKLQKELDREAEKMKKLKLKHPLLFRRCGDKPCCQAVTADGSLCHRPALTDKTYYQAIHCCYLCWQHALGYGVYTLLKMGQTISTAQLDWDTYCAYYPQECEEMLKRGKEG